MFYIYIYIYIYINIEFFLHFGMLYFELQHCNNCNSATA